jgi:hypothetical protein
VGLFSKKQTNIPRRRVENSDITSRSILSDSFRRNRNLSGSTQATAESPRIKVHHLSIKRQKLSFILLASLVIIAFLSFLIMNFTAAVSVGFSNSNFSQAVDAKKYQDAIQDYLDANPLGRFHFLLDEQGLNNYVNGELTEVKSVVQKTMTGLGVTEFEITMREPVASWKINEKQYYVDKDGVAFETNYFSDQIVKVIDNSGASLEAGQASISKRFLGFVGQVVSLCGKAGYSVSEAVLPSNTTRQLNIKLKDSNLLVKMTIDRSAAEQVSNMGRAVEYFKTNNKTPTYIDVRVNNKVFYI